MTERTDWPIAALTPLARARALAAAIPGAGYREAVFDVAYDVAWPRLADLERSVPRADRAVRSLTVKERRTIEDGVEELRFTAASPIGLLTPFTARLEDGFCLMRAKWRLYVVVMAAEPTDDGRTRFGQIEAVPRRGGRLLRWLMRITTADDVKGFRKVATSELCRRDLASLRRLQDEAGIESEVNHVEAEVLFAEGRPEQAYRLLRAHMQESETDAARSFSTGIHQVTGNMQQQLTERRQQLETARSNTRLQQIVISIGVIFLISSGLTLVWLWRQAAQLQAARRRAEEANRAKSEFLANMSHEIRTPLNGVVSMADALARRDLDAQEHEMVELIRSSGATLERLLSDILDSAKIESGQVAIEPVAFDLEQTVGDVAALWRVKAEDKHVALEVDFDPALGGHVEGDAVRVRQVLTNLVSNALKFTSEGAVRLTVSAAGEGRVLFRVTDTGLGFDGDTKSRIFGRFQQADGSITRRFGGTGLGLTISSALVELLGGTLDCDSTPGEGSAFWFDIPLPAAEAPAAPVETETAAADVAAAPLRILLADDHPANRKVVEIMLAATAMEMVAVENGQEALDAFVNGGFDVVLMDMQMPVMDGLTSTRKIREHEAAHGLARTPVLMLTANAMAEHVEAGRLAGADGHVTKPVTLASLFAAISNALDVEAREAA